MKLSLVVPCYNEAEVLPIFRKAVQDVRPQLRVDELEVVFVDDGSRDATLSILQQFNREDASLRYVSFSRNFGKEAAIYAGLQHATGDLVCLMDADMQDPPSLLPEMVAACLDEGYDTVGTRRSTRAGEPPIRSFFARCFYRFINHISDTKLVDGARDYRLMRRPVVDAILAMPEYNRFSKGIFQWVGYKTKWLEYENVERAAGETKWSFWKLLKYSFEGIISFSTVPLALASFMGMLLCVIAMVTIVVLAVRHFLDPMTAVYGWTSLVCLIMFIGGVQLLCMGILGQYIAKAYLEIKKRPMYIIGGKSE